MRGDEDSIDAEVLAHFTKTIRPDPRSIEDSEVRAFDALLGHRHQLIGIRTMESNRLASCSEELDRADDQRQISWLERRGRRVPSPP